MYKHILLATDGSEIAGKAVDQGIALAQALGAELTAVTVTEPYEAVVAGTTVGMVLPNDYDDQCKSYAAELLGKVVEKAKAAGATCDINHQSNRWPYDGIAKAAAQAGADLIVVGSHGRRGFEGLLLGSETTKLLTHTKIPTLVIR